MKMQIKLLLAIAISAICVFAWAQEPKPESNQTVPAAKARQPGATVRAEAQSVAVVTVAPTVNTNDYNPSTDRNEAAACTKNLEKINAGIEAYRKDNHDVPRTSGKSPSHNSSRTPLDCQTLTPP